MYSFTLTCPSSPVEESTIVKFSQTEEEDKDEAFDATKLIVQTQACYIVPSPKSSPEQAIETSPKNDDLYQLAISL